MSSLFRLLSTVDNSLRRLAQVAGEIFLIVQCMYFLQVDLVNLHWQVLTVLLKFQLLFVCGEAFLITEKSA